MKVLIADDDDFDRELLEGLLRHWGYDIVAVQDGADAWQALQAAGEPLLVVLDWMLPRLDGVEVCRLVRRQLSQEAIYLILLTGRDDAASVVQGLEAGANDYLTKPFDRHELRARLQVGARLVGLQRALTDKARQLEQTLDQLRQLQGLVPICAWCKKIRDDSDFWSQVEDYITAHAEVRFARSVCPECAAHAGA